MLRCSIKWMRRVLRFRLVGQLHVGSGGVCLIRSGGGGWKQS